MFGTRKTSINLPTRDCSKIRFKVLRLPLFFFLVALTALVGVRMMMSILEANGWSVLELFLLILFSTTFTWIVLSFWNGVIGFILQLFSLDPLTLRRPSYCQEKQSPLLRRTAVVMPVYNENTAQIIAGFESSFRSLVDTGEVEHFDFYLLSDTQNPELIEAELGAWQDLTQRLGPLARHVHYRRRQNNHNCKPGNLRDFCLRWGSNYEGMIVLDADSLMTGDCMLALARTMAANPAAGLIQTVPIPVRQNTFFGRFLQFAATVHSPVLAHGMAFWQTDTANYWGHNAIIRIDAFMKNCGLPRLAGEPPFGGEILSHDFVEAALLRRAGWKTFLLPDIKGSYEEVPGNIRDYLKRDRRWVQGNLQHLGLVTAPGMHVVSRLHFVTGALAYITSLLWFLILSFSTLDAVLRATTENVFFVNTPQLFPDWPITQVGVIFNLLYFTVTLLFLPKLLGMVLAITQMREEFGGTLPLVASTLLETLFAILIAPLMMIYHTYLLICSLLGFKVKWETQARGSGTLLWCESIRLAFLPTSVGLCWAGITWYFTPIFFWWLTPVLLGLVISAPIIRYSSSPGMGERLREFGLLLCPIEKSEPWILKAVRIYLSQLPLHFPKAAPVPPLPVERWQAMPIQSFRLETTNESKELV